MVRFALLVGLLVVGCVGEVDGGLPAQRRILDVSLFAPAFEAAGTASADETNEPETVQPALDPSNAPAESVAAKVAESAPIATDAGPANTAVTAPAPAAATPAPSPNLPPAPGCVAVDGGWVCEQACVPVAPVPSALDEQGQEQAFTHDGRQLCGGRAPDGCGGHYEFDLPCAGDDLCGGEGVDASGHQDEEQWICAECRLETDPAVLEVCGYAGRTVALAGCQPQADCYPSPVTGSDGRTRTVQCCTAVPVSLR